MIHLVIGGARSGKSSYAEKLALEAAAPKGTLPLYIATCEPFDEELKARIIKHRQRREGLFSTVEESLYLGRAVRDCASKADVAMIDFITIWLGNLQHHRMMDEQIKDFMDAIGSFPAGKSLFIVSNELGSGLVPESAISREYRDTAGFLNQHIDRISDKVTLMVAGIPMELKK